MTKDPLGNFCRNVSRLMKEKDFSGLELGKKCGISSAIFSDMARGEANPNFKTMLAIAEGLEVPFWLLIEPEGSPAWELYYSLNPLRPKLPRGYGYIPAGIPISLEKLNTIKRFAYKPRTYKSLK